MVTIAYDALTGEQRAVAYARGTSSNAEDVPTGMVVSPDGSRVFVSATTGNGPGRTLLATLTDAGGPLAGRQIAFSSGGQHLGTAVTGADGAARLSGLPPAYRGRSRPFEAVFAGDARHAPATATTTS